ncbi:MAG: ABC transporter substrate-binding protein [Thermoplasmata archaeon]
MEDARAAEQKVLRWGMFEGIDSLNPFIGVNDNAYIFYGLIYDYLVAVDQDLNPKPNLAVSWNIVPDEEPYGSVWQYNLTRNAYWHDGEPFDADDVVFTVNYQIGPNYDSMWAYQPYTIFIKSVQKVDDYTVRIEFKNITGQRAPCPFGDKLMMPIVPEHIWSEISAFDAGFSYENRKPIGTGPFMCTDSTWQEYLNRNVMVLLANKDYHGWADYGERVNFDRLELHFYLEPVSMLTDIQTGKIDMAMFNAPNFKNLNAWLLNHPDAPIDTCARLTCTSYSIDLLVCMKEDAGANTNPLRLDPAVRRAMAHAIDKEFIRDSIYAGYAEVGSTILSPIYDEFWSPGPTEVFNYDLAAANATLDAAGYVWNAEHTRRVAGPDNPWYPNGELKFTIVVEAELVEDRDTALFLQDEWAKIGIGLDIMIVSTGQWNTIVYNYNYDLAMSYWSGDPDPTYLLFVQTTYSIGGWSENAYSNPVYDETFVKCTETLDPEERAQYMKECQRIMYNDCAFIVTVYPYGCYAWRTDRFEGWGDWEAHPGRSLSNYWTANPLYFELTPRVTDQDGGQGGISATVYLAIGAAAAVATVAAVVLLLRRKPGRPRKEEEEIRLP